MSGVDNRIVTMKFDNREFENNAKTSLSTLQKLKESMSFGSIVGGTIKGLDSISGALSKIGLKTPFAPLISTANKGLGMVGGVLDKLGMKNPFSSSIQSASELQKAAMAAGGPAGMGALEGGVTAVSAKFVALSTIAITALSNITNKAINAGTSWLKSFSVAPVMDGLREYELNLKSIQTVQANTDQPLPKIIGALDELNQYSDQTIYNFAEMAKNVGTFTAAGVSLETSVSAIKGIANMAALSGSNSQQAATAMYQLSQALASGKVGLMDWNSVVNAGMGGKKLQTALAETAIAMGKIDKAALKGTKSGEQLTIMGSSFRESIMAQPGQESWLTSKILENSLAALDGRYSVAALKQQVLEDGTKKYKTTAQALAAVEKARNAAAKDGVKYSDEQFKALQKLSTSSFEAATKVKTLGQVFDIAKETIASGWSASFRNIFGDLEQAKDLFTELSEGLSGMISDNAIARNELLAAWSKSKIGGRETLIDGFRSGLTALMGVLVPLKEGFRDIFPANKVKDLRSMTVAFADFMKNLIPGEKTMANIRDISGGFFSIFSIGGQILGGAIDMFKSLFDTLGAGNGSFLDFVAGIGNSVKEFDAFLEKSGLVETFFSTVGKVLSVPIALLRGLADIVGGIFDGFDQSTADKVQDGIGAIGDRLSGLEVIGNHIRNFFIGVGEFFGNLGGHIGRALVGIGDVVAGAFTADTFGSTLDVINTTLLGGLVLMIRKFFNGSVNIDLSGGLFDGIKQTLGEATGAFQNMQAKLKADILLKLAISIGAMAAALLVLSMIDPASLSKALAAMAGGFGILIATMATMMKVMGPVGVVQLWAISSAMLKMSLAIVALSLALKTLASIKFGEMLRGLAGLSIMLFVLKKAILPLAANSKGMAKASFSLILVGIALNILAVALKIFATMSWEEMARGLAGLTGTLIALAIGLKLMPPLNAQAVTLIALGVAINLLAVALKIFATMSWEEMAKGMLMLAGSLGVISLALRTMPKGMLLKAVALNAVAAAMVVLSGALKIMGSMGWESIAKGLVLMGGALGIIAIGLNAIGLVGTIGAIGLVAAAGALAVMAPILITLGSLSWETIAKGLSAIAGILTIFGVAGYLLAPVIPIILGLGAAMLLFGAGLALAGAGALAAAMAFGIVVAAGVAGAQVLAVMLATIIASIPAALSAFGKGVVQFAVAIGQGAPKIAAAFSKVLSNLLDSVIKNTPKMARAFLVMLQAALRVIVTAIPMIVNAGLRLIGGFLQAISKNLPKIIDLATDIIVKFLDGIARNLDRIIDSGIKLIIAFVRGLARGIRENQAEMGEAGLDLASALIEGITSGISSGAGLIKDAAINAAREAWQAAKDFFKIRSPSRLMRDTVGKPIPQGMALGVRDGAPEVVNEIGVMGKMAIGRMGEVMKGVDDAFALDPNFNPTISPVLDLTALTQEANKMSSILATAPIMAGVSYETAADISSMTQAADEAAAGSGGDAGGDQYLTLEQHLHSPKPIDSVESYRAGKTLISLAKETLK